MSEDVDQREDLNPEITLEGSEDRRRIQHLHLVLTAASIESSIRHEGGRYLLVIPPLYFEQASLEIKTYLKEQEAALKIAAKTPVTSKPRKTGRALVFDHPALDDVSAASHTLRRVDTHSR